MAVDKFSNFAKMQLSAGYDASATILSLVSGHGARCPAVPFNAVWYSTTYVDPTDDPNREVVRVTARSTDTITVTRAQEGTSASVKNAAGTYQLIANLTAATLNDSTPGVMFASTASGTVSNSTSEASLIGSGAGSVTLKANRAAAGTSLRLSAYGLLSTAAVPGTLRIRLKFGSTVVLDSGAQTPVGALSSLLVKVEAALTVRAIGASGSIIGQSAFESQMASLAALVAWPLTTSGTVTVDTTADKDIGLTAQWGTADAGNILTMTNVLLEVLR